MFALPDGEFEDYSEMMTEYRFLYLAVSICIFLLLLPIVLLFKNSRTRKVKTPFGTDIAIDGIDAKKGVFISGGSAESYYEILALFQDDGLRLKREIRKSLEDGNFPDYTTYVHALKSAAANIGAEKLISF